MVSVLLIDDDAELSKLLEEYLQSEQLELAWIKRLTTNMPW
jgi:DNA-binding response OmpR family regulator